MEVIKSKDNATIKLYSKLANNRKDRKKYNQFVLEGVRIVLDAISENAPIVQVLISESAYDKYYKKLVDLNITKLLIISNELACKISSTESTQGVFAICEIPKNYGITLKPNGKYIVVYQVQDPGNVGMIVRTADAFGLDGVILSQSCDFYSPKVIRSTMGAIFRVPFVIVDSLPEVISQLKQNSVAVYAGHLKGDVFYKQDYRGGSAFLIGNEGNGLTDEITALADYKIKIPMKGKVESLNAAVSATILMYETMRQREYM